MVEFGKSRLEEKPVWYQTWRGALIAIFFILLFFLVNRISVANCYVALLTVGFSYLFLRVRSRAAKLIFGALWLLFLPNAAYLFTDQGHIIYQWNNKVVSPSGHILLLTQYLLLELFGVITFLFSFLPFEKIINRVNIFTSIDLFGLTVFFGLLCNFIYFLFRRLLLFSPLV